MTYQIIYSSEATTPMESDDLEALLEKARSKNAAHGISGALVYTDRVFLQILEGEEAELQALMAKILKDPRHEAVTILREGDVPTAHFESWGMAYVGATPDQAAQWAGLRGGSGSQKGIEDVSADLRRTAQFVKDIRALLAPETAAASAGQSAVDTATGSL